MVRLQSQSLNYIVVFSDTFCDFGYALFKDEKSMNCYATELLHCSNMLLFKGKTSDCDCDLHDCTPMAIELNLL